MLTGLLDEKFNEKPNRATIRPDKGQTDILKARKSQKFWLYCYSHVFSNCKRFSVCLKPQLA